MGSLKWVLLLGGILGFYYCTTRLSTLEPMAPQATFGEYVRRDAGRFELGRYVCAGAAAVGALLLLFPKTR